MPRAATRTAGPSTGTWASAWGTTIDTAAVTVPSAPRTGAATDRASSVTWRSLTATPDLRTSASTRRSRSGAVIVYGVKDARSPSQYSFWNTGSPWASRASPTPVACSGQRAPTRMCTPTADRPDSHSM